MPRVPLIALLLVLLALGLMIGAGVRGDSPTTPASTSSQALAAFSSFEATDDPDRLRIADDLATAALDADPTDLLAVETSARVALARRDFPGALILADRAAALAPHRPTPVGLRADALLGLGRYRSAFSAVERRLQRRPDLSSYARAATAAELRGDVDRAHVLMDLAVDAASARTSGRRWAQLGQITLSLRYGRADHAERLIAEAARDNPADPALAVRRGRLAAQRGDLRGARREYLEAVAARSRPDDLAALAEIEQALGEDDSASRHLDEASEALATASEYEDNALEQAAFAADWAVPGSVEVAAARAARARQPSVIGDSVLAWVLARSGQCEEAVGPARRSLRLGTRDPLMRFRAAFAEACAGRAAAASRIATVLVAETPHFSTRWAPAARAIAVGAMPELPVSPVAT